MIGKFNPRDFVVRPGDSVILCGLMGARKTAFAAEHLLLSANYQTVSNIPLTATAAAPNHTHIADGDIYPALDGLRDCVLVWDEAGAWFATAGKVQIDNVAAWLATIRHRQVSVVFICQSPEQLERRILFLTAATVALNNLTRRLGWIQQSLVRIHTGFRYSHELRKQKSDGVITSGRWSPYKKTFQSFQSVDFGNAAVKTRMPSSVLYAVSSIIVIALVFGWFILSGNFLNFFNHDKPPPVVLSESPTPEAAEYRNLVCVASGANAPACVFLPYPSPPVAPAGVVIRSNTLPPADPLKSRIQAIYEGR